jgi:histidinol-phosphate/aromatic aminotransferase/cobyric acid decarboxylase-like protein
VQPDGGKAAMLSTRVHGNAYATPSLVDLAVNVWPAPRPPALQRALRAALDEHRYPDERPARDAIAARHDRPPDEVVVTSGACDAFWLLANALRPRHAACIDPTFTEPEAALRAVGADVASVAREPDGWTFDPRDVPARADVVVIGNPNNPTGSLTSGPRILALRRPGRVVVVDESFMDFVEGEPDTLAGTLTPGLVVVRSLTKLWSLAGVRAGYVLGPPELIARLAAHRQPWSVNAMACAAAAYCACDRETPPRVAREVAALRACLLARLAALEEVRAWPSAANFVLLRVPDGPSVVDRLRRTGIAVRPAATFRGLDDRYLRVAVRSVGACDAFVDALTEALG